MDVFHHSGLAHAAGLWSLLKLPGHLARAKNSPQTHVGWPDSVKHRYIFRQGCGDDLSGGRGPRGPGWAASFLHCPVGTSLSDWVSQKLHGGCFWDADYVFISGSASGPCCHSPRLAQIFPPLTSWRPDAPGFIDTTEEEKRADTPPHRFRSENWLPCPAAGLAQVG